MTGNSGSGKINEILRTLSKQHFPPDIVSNADRTRLVYELTYQLTENIGLGCEIEIRTYPELNQNCKNKKEKGDNLQKDADNSFGKYFSTALNFGLY